MTCPVVVAGTADETEAATATAADIADADTEARAVAVADVRPTAAVIAAALRMARVLSSPS